MGLSAEFLAMIWGEVERNNLWDCQVCDVRNALMGYPGF